MLFIENVKLALTAVRSNKMRSFLTMLGIIIGISSVIAIASIGEGAKAVIDKEFSAFGKNNVFVYMNWQMAGDYIENSDMITADDINALKARFPDELEYIASWESASGETTVGRLKGKFEIQGVSGNYDKYKRMTLIHGRMPTDDDVRAAREFIVIPKAAALYFFNTENAVGKTIPFSILGDMKDLTVIGVYDVEESLFTSMSGSDAYAAYAPYTLWYGGQDIYTLYLDLYIGSDYDISKTTNAITSYLAKIKNKPEGYYISDSVAAQQSMMDELLGTLSVAIGAIAAISLLVGGIGIMNIMLVSVTERTREIGIRKSLGARTGDILVQFLIEAMIISAIGGLIGTALGMGVAAIGLSFVGVAVSINPAIVAIAVGFSAAVGMFFGLFPARKAARLDPIEALRYE